MSELSILPLLRDYLAHRRRDLESEIAAEVLAGNTVKESNARWALTEITALEMLLEPYTPENENPR